MPDLIHHLPNNTIMRFALAGVINTLFGFFVYSTAILLGVAVSLALLAGVTDRHLYRRSLQFSNDGWLCIQISLAQAITSISSDVRAYLCVEPVIDRLAVPMYSQPHLGSSHRDTADGMDFICFDGALGVQSR